MKVKKKESNLWILKERRERTTWEGDKGHKSGCGRSLPNANGNGNVR